MEPHNFECDLQSLRRLYGLLQSNANKESIPQAFLLDENTSFLLKRLLDSETEELLARQSRILAQVQLGLPERVSTPSRKESLSRGIIKLPSKAGYTEEVVDSIERIETQLSAFRFCSSRVASHDETRRLSEKALTERRQSYQASVSGRRSTYMPLTSVNSAAGATARSRDDPNLPLHSQGSCSPDDQFVRVGSRPPLPPLPVRSVGFKKPSQSSRRRSQKTASMKPTLLDQESETWEEDSVESTRSGTSEEGEELVSSEQESGEASGETRSTSGKSYETQAESVTESDSSYPPESDSDGSRDSHSQVSDSPPREKRDRSSDHAKQRKKAMGRFTRIKNKLGEVFHHHHHHHHHHHPGKEERRKPSAWKHLHRKFHHKDKEKSGERRRKSESGGLTTHKNKAGKFHELVEGFVRHKRLSKKQKHKLQSYGRKMDWWQTFKRQGGAKFPNGGRPKRGKKFYLCSKDQEHDVN